MALADERERSTESFPTTRWFLVARAGQEPSGGQRPALSELLQRYLPALRAHLVQTRHLAPDAADDVLQSFVATKFLAQNLAGQANPARGRFRTLLLTALDRFAVSEWRRQTARKRTAEHAGPLDPQQSLPASSLPPAEAFDVAWARQVLSEAVRRIEAECRSAGRRELWGVFECRILLPTLEGRRPPEYAELVSRFGFRSPSQASNALLTAKRMFERTLRAVVGEYASSPGEVEDEIRDLRTILSRAGAKSG